MEFAPVDVTAYPTENPPLLRRVDVNCLYTRCDCGNNVHRLKIMVRIGVRIRANRKEHFQFNADENSTKAFLTFSQDVELERHDLGKLKCDLKSNVTLAIFELNYIELFSSFTDIVKIHSSTSRVIK